MFEPQPQRKNVGTGHCDNIEPQKLSHYAQNRVYCRGLVIPFMENLGQRWLHLLLKRRPHHQSDHQQVQEKHRRLAYTMSPVAPPPRENSSESERYSHDDLHDEVEIRPESSAGTEKALH